VNEHVSLRFCFLIARYSNCSASGGGVVLERRDNSLPSIITSKVELLKIAEKEIPNLAVH
jgi:hypothetical protein